MAIILDSDTDKLFDDLELLMTRLTRSIKFVRAIGRAFAAEFLGLLLNLIALFSF